MRNTAGRFEAICSEHSKLVYNFLYRFLGNAEDAEDALNETYRRAHKGLGSFRGECSEKAWIMRIATNVAKRSKVNQRRFDHESLDSHVDGERPHEPADPRNLEGEVVASDMAQRLLDSLPQPQREAVWMRVGLQMTDEEVGESLGVPTGTVKSWVWRSVARLRQAYAVMD